MKRSLFLIGLLALGASGCRQSPPAEPQADQAQANEAAAAETQPAQLLDRSQAGTAAPKAVFLSPEGGKVSIADFRGRPVLVNLWATWCAPCVTEMPLLDSLAGQNGELQVLTVSQDAGDKGKAKALAFFAGKKFAHIQAYTDPDNGLTDAFAVISMPTTVLFDKDGKEVWRVIGPEEWNGKKAAALIAEASAKKS